MQALLLAQYRDEEGQVRAARVADDGRSLEPLVAEYGVYELALLAAQHGKPLAEIVERRATGKRVDYAGLISEKRLAAPIHHPDPAHLLVSGTGLTHRASAASRDSMHAAAAEGRETDSMRMYRLGEEGGRPEAGEAGAAPEWFFKGDGQVLVEPEGDLPLPAFAEDGGEEVEIAGIYVIAPDGRPMRVGFALGNEFSDHKLERQNYLYLAHSKLRACSVGPEILVGAPPEGFAGEARIVRRGDVVWRKGFESGPAAMCHSLANLEHHHFKYAPFRRPGDVHVHFFGAAAVSCADNFETREGDVFEIEAAPFVTPLRNAMRRAPQEGFVAVTPL